MPEDTVPEETVERAEETVPEETVGAPEETLPEETVAKTLQRFRSCGSWLTDAVSTHDPRPPS